MIPTFAQVAKVIPMSQYGTAAMLTGQPYDQQGIIAIPNPSDSMIADLEAMSKASYQFTENVTNGTTAVHKDSVLKYYTQGSGDQRVALVKFGDYIAQT